MSTDEQISQSIEANVAETQVLSRKTAAKLLNVHPSFIDTLCSRGELEKIELGTHCKRITLTSINDFLSRAPKS